MRKSLLEQVPDKIMFSLLKKIYDSVDDYSTFDDLDTACQTYLKIMGITEVDYTDISYVMEIMKLNENDLEGGEMTQPLRRPKLSLYSYPYTVYEVQTTRTDFELPIPSYSSNIEDVHKLKEFMDEMGDINEWDQDPTRDAEVVDGHHDETTWDRKGIYKVK